MFWKSLSFVIWERVKMILMSTYNIGFQRELIDKFYHRSLLSVALGCCYVCCTIHFQVRKICKEKTEKEKVLSLKEDEIKKLDGKLHSAVSEKSSLQAKVASLEKDFKELRKSNEILKSKVRQWFLARQAKGQKAYVMTLCPLCSHPCIYFYFKHLFLNNRMDFNKTSQK